MSSIFEALRNRPRKQPKKHFVKVGGKEIEVSLEKKLEIIRRGEDRYMLEENQIVLKPERNFLLETLDWEKTNKKSVHRWRAKNNINGLVYGNGGLVGWDKQTCYDMKTHENAITEESQIDFCWGVPHENLHNCYSTTVINASEQQAFVAGYREGVKMSTEKGKPIPPEDFQKVWPNNLRILSTWCTVGADVEYGKYAMLGARMGCFNTVIEAKNEHFKIRDLDNMELYYEDQSPTDIDTDLLMYGNSLRQQLDMPIAEYDDDDSKFYRFVIPPHINKGVQDREY